MYACAFIRYECRFVDVHRLTIHVRDIFPDFFAEVIFLDTAVLNDYFPLFLKAAVLTVKLGIAGILISVLVGLICSLISFCRIPVLKTLVKIYIEISRNTPLLIQLFFIYSGLPKIGIKTDPSACGVAGLAFLGGSYMAETFRSGLDSVAKIHSESEYSLGMNRFQTFIYVIFPQALSASIPPFTANVIFLLKETSVFSAVSLMDLMFTAKDLIGLYYNTAESLFLLVIFYLIILLPVSVLGTLAERRFGTDGTRSSPKGKKSAQAF